MHAFSQYLVMYILTPIPPNTATSTFANSVDPDQMDSKGVIWPGPILFALQFVNLNEYIISSHIIG